MATCSNQRTPTGLAAIRLGNAVLSLVVLPGIAGKLIELTDLRSGRNWLWANPGIPYMAPVFGAHYDCELDSGGWDEVFPSIAPGDITCDDGARCAVPDHGDLVGMPWRLAAADVTADGSARCVLEVEGRSLPFRWRRTIAVAPDAPRVVLSYRIENRGSHSWPFLYCAHPLLDIGRGVRIEFPEGLDFRVESSHGLPPDSASRGRWPWLALSDSERIDLSSCLDAGEATRPFATKVFIRSPEPGHISVVGAAGDRMTISYGADWLPWLGLWINNRGWSGASGEPYRNLAIEPATAPTDSLAEAVAAGQVRSLAPGDSREWSLVVELES